MTAMSRQPDERARIPGWVIAASLVVIGAIGGTAVYVAGTIVHRRDRERIARYEDATRATTALIHDTIDVMERLWPRSRSTTTEEIGSFAAAHRRPLERARSEMLALSVPDILREAHAARLNATVRALDAITALDRIVAGEGRAGPIETFRENAIEARAQQDLADAELLDVRCAAGLDC